MLVRFSCYRVAVSVHAKLQADLAFVTVLAALLVPEARAKVQKELGLWSCRGSQSSHEPQCVTCRMSVECNRQKTTSQSQEVHSTHLDMSLCCCPHRAGGMVSQVAGVQTGCWQLTGGQGSSHQMLQSKGPDSLQ